MSTKKICNEKRAVAVWAKMKGFSWWPGRICTTIPHNVLAPKNTNGRQLIYYFGTHNYSWVHKNDLKAFEDFKTDFSEKNKRAGFLSAIAEIEEWIATEAKACPIDLQDMEIATLKSTFGSAKDMLDTIFNGHNRTVDRFIRPSYDYLTVLYQLLSPVQQTEMYKCIQKSYADKAEYIHTLKHENLFWNVMLPEWALFICLRKFSMTKEQLLKQIFAQDMDANNNSLDDE